jgi:hypothetical protein
MRRRTPDGLTVTPEPQGLRAVGAHTNALFEKQHDADAFIARYRKALRKLENVLRPRWAAFDGTKLSEEQLADLLQRIVIHWFYYYNINYGRLKIRAGTWVWDDLKHPQTYLIVQQVAGERVPRGEAGHDELCAALLGIGPDEYRRWAKGNDAFESMW